MQHGVSLSSSKVEGLIALFVETLTIDLFISILWLLLVSSKKLSELNLKFRALKCYCLLGFKFQLIPTRGLARYLYSHPMRLFTEDPLDELDVWSYAETILRLNPQDGQRQTYLLTFVRYREA